MARPEKNEPRNGGPSFGDGLPSCPISRVESVYEQRAKKDIWCHSDSGKVREIFGGRTRRGLGDEKDEKTATRHVKIKIAPFTRFGHELSNTPAEKVVALRPVTLAKHKFWDLSMTDGPSSEAPGRIGRSTPQNLGPLFRASKLPLVNSWQSPTFSESSLRIPIPFTIEWLITSVSAKYLAHIGSKCLQLDRLTQVTSPLGLSAYSWDPFTTAVLKALGTISRDRSVTGDLRRSLRLRPSRVGCMTHDTSMSRTKVPPTNRSDESLPLRHHHPSFVVSKWGRGPNSVPPSLPPAIRALLYPLCRVGRRTCQQPDAVNLGYLIFRGETTMSQGSCQVEYLTHRGAMRTLIECTCPGYICTFARNVPSRTCKHTAGVYVCSSERAENSPPARELQFMPHSWVATGNTDRFSNVATVTPLQYWPPTPAGT
ncbi:uncharacterized protein LAESUDRAFT_750336 [Laetiporus sulphureus 93-53]|uniref:SWIM-type domain-containing protein n=1 Tax=Laetiporus sulphureus 93-53 TaxID=1314785 RepID=A0A165DZ60_9APHY|nr:uncharacterized protein LAESUDRAFT_750336 [Laetiporus sulphureus 93-53]KZT05934.1 hypothetical protein LAESUDRAFT_750336 [Laetiporus sulphureus 93-53]